MSEPILIIEGPDPGMMIGLEMIMTQASILSLLPVEKWLDEIHKSDTTMPFIDPTLYMKWLSSNRRDYIIDILNAVRRLNSACKEFTDAAREGKVR